MSKIFQLKVTSSITHEGDIKTPGQVILVAESLARDLLRRGKAVPDDSDLTGDQDDAPMGGQDAPQGAANDEGKAQAPGDDQQGVLGDSKPDAKPSEGLTVAQLKDALAAKGVEFDPAAKKADLAALLDA